jgi:hypothetical protein
MAKRSRTYAPPPGALIELRNRRLYGGREEQIEGMALRSRGITGRPMADPDRPRDVSDRPAPARGPRTERADTPRAFARRVDKARVAMEDAQRAVSPCPRERGQDTTAAAHDGADAARGLWLALAGGMPAGRPIELAQASDANKVKAAA